MEKIQILSIGRDPVLLQKLSAFINENPHWESNATVDDETSIEVFHQRKFDIILFIDSIGDESEKSFVLFFLSMIPILFSFITQVILQDCWPQKYRRRSIRETMVEIKLLMMYFTLVMMNDCC